MSHYTDLMKQCLMRVGFDDLNAVELADRLEGRDWPPTAETMIGDARLQNVIDLITNCILSHVPGDFLEAGVWRGGACILAAATLREFSSTRTVWVADSFMGLPRPDPAFPVDANDPHWQYPELAVAADQVRLNFARYGLLNERVQFLEGWFKDTLPGPVKQLAILRSDGDMYGSTWETLEALYPLVSAGGYIILDDYAGAENGCHKATDDFRAKHGITEPFVQVDHSCAYWRRER